MQIETVIFRLQEQHQYFYYQFLYGFSVIDILHISSPHPLHCLMSSILRIDPQASYSLRVKIFLCISSLIIACS